MGRTLLGASVSRLDAVARQLEMLVLLESPSEVRAAFEARLDDIVRAQAGAQRSMKLDTLGMELTRAVQEARQWLELKDEAVGVLAELAQVEGEEVKASRARLSGVLASHGASSDSKPLAHALQTARTALDHYAKLAAARSRRAVVLEGLAKLGYSVTEGMETAWTESRRLVLQKPGLQGYAVELAGPADAQRLQVRTVALGGGPVQCRRRAHC